MSTTLKKSLKLLLFSIVIVNSVSLYSICPSGQTATSFRFISKCCPNCTGRYKPSVDKFGQCQCSHFDQNRYNDCISHHNAQDYCIVWATSIKR